MKKAVETVRYFGYGRSIGRRVRREGEAALREVIEWIRYSKTSPGGSIHAFSMTHMEYLRKETRRREDMDTYRPNYAAEQNSWPECLR